MDIFSKIDHSQPGIRPKATLKRSKSPVIVVIANAGSCQTEDFSIITCKVRFLGGKW